MDPYIVDLYGAIDLHGVIIVLAHLALLGIGVWLLVIDIGSHRLPDRIVLPTLAGALALVLTEVLLTGDSARPVGALWGMLLLGGFYALLRLLSRGGFGGGDVKLAALIGLILGWHGAQALVIGTAAAFVLGALYALGLIVLRRANRHTHIAFGPWMILGGVLGVAVG